MAESTATLSRPLTGAPPVRRSPLQHRADELERAGRADVVALREVPFLTQFNIRIRYAAGQPVPPETALPLPSPLGLPRTPNTVHRAGGRSAVWLGPDEWLVVGPPGTATEAEGAIATALREVAAATACAAYTDVSAHSTALRLSGRRSRDVLRKVCSIDVHPRVFGGGACAQTLLARAARVLLVADGEPDTFLIFVRASFADYVADWLLDAMAEYAGGPDSGADGGPWTLTNEKR
ncbi:sarcosine oxidase subunit gamma [Streptomyces winkii]|uniref:sarcosine oxidase subunit gamma n=1 Tax=Streptomyces winkii TaxID=3051178 RepID=UPI0028D8EE91|nr:sarcosine oxidase subunit gamma family protein [Streptomyces sp. DSM 40971]